MISSLIEDLFYKRILIYNYGPFYECQNSSTYCLFSTMLSY